MIPRAARGLPLRVWAARVAWQVVWQRWGGEGMRQRDWDEARPDADGPAPEAAPERSRPRQRAGPPGRAGAGPRYGQDQYDQGDDNGYPGRDPRGRGRDESGRDGSGREDYGRPASHRDPDGYAEDPRRAEYPRE